MAAGGCARRALTSSFSCPPRVLAGGLRSTSSATAPTAFFARSLSRRRLPSNFSRMPAELGCALSLMPLHSVTASALLTSMLSLKAGSWAWLSEGFATPL